MPSKDGCVKTQLWCIVFLLAFLHRVRRLASEIGAIRRISHHNFRKLEMWSVTTLLVIGAVMRAISQAPLFHAHFSYEVDHYHRHSQMPENTDLFLLIPTPLFPRALTFILGSFFFLGSWEICDAIVHSTAMDYAANIFREITEGQLGLKSMLLFENESYKAMAAKL